jgi:HD-like signal output (HDOD) protein
LRLGFKAVANLALTSGSAGFFKGYGRSTARSNESLWTESMHTALNARRIAARDGRVDSELAYTVGLLQNIGHIVIDRFQKEQKEAITAELEKGTDLLTAERAVLGIDHAQAGALMIRRWGLPRKLIRGIQFHHAPARAAAESVLWAICAQAEELTGLSLGTQGSAMVYKTDGSKWDLTLPDAEERDVWLDRNREEIAAAAG